MQAHPFDEVGQESIFRLLDQCDKRRRVWLGRLPTREHLTGAKLRLPPLCRQSLPQPLSEPPAALEFDPRRFDSLPSPRCPNPCQRSPMLSRTLDANEACGQPANQTNLAL